MRNAANPGPLLVAHRGASAYRPEHTLASYALAIEQGADFIEPDLQITKDGQLIAMHDVTLDRTTNVETVYPDRFREEVVRGATVHRWYAIDFTLDEIRRLDAGSWFRPEFAGARVPTLDEVIELARGKAGIFPETKAPDTYADRGYRMERLLLENLKRHGLDRPGADPATPVIIQSFSAESLRILRHDLGSALPLTFLLSGGAAAAEWLSDAGLLRVKSFASGIGPTRSLLSDDPSAVARAHAVGLTVIPYTFGATEASDYERLAAELKYFLCTLRVDGLFINNPDLFPRGPCE